MKANLGIIFLFIVSSLCYSQEKETEKKSSKLVYEKTVYFSVKQERSSEFTKWIKKNQKEYAESLPKGWKFLGCYYTVFHIGRHQWQFRYEIQGMAAYDNLALDKSEKFSTLLSEIYGFIDRQLPMETEIVKQIKSDTEVIEKDK